MESNRIIEHVCLNCGKQLPQTPTLMRRLYCNDKCKGHYRYKTTPEERKDRLQRRKLSNLQNPYKQTLICGYCGKAFEAYVLDYRRFCSRKCSSSAHRYNDDERRTNIGIDIIPRGRDTREEALRLHREGLEYYEIAKQLKLNNETVRQWIRYAEKCSLAGCSSHITENHFRYVYANTVDIWLGVLRDEMRLIDFKATGTFIQNNCVHLICGATSLGNRNADILVTLISEKYGLNPFNGDYYAFCTNVRIHMRYVRWDGSAFQVTSRRRECGQYVWPPARLGGSITVSAHEFEFILSGSNPSRLFDKKVNITL